MKIAIWGTGMVGTTLGSALLDQGHEVCLGARTADHEGATAWAADMGPKACHDTFEGASRWGEVTLCCVKGEHAVDAAASVPTDVLEGSILIDVSNPLDFSGGFPPRLTVCNTDSNAERLQKAHPGARVVKALNTVNCEVMVQPGALPEPTTVFVAGDDDEARARVATWLQEWFGWQDVLDLGDLTAARGLEAWLLLWPRIMSSLGHAHFNLRIVRPAKAPVR